MNCAELTREELISAIEELKLLNRQLLDEQEQQARLDFSWTGNLGHWYWNLKANTVTFNPLKVTTLGYTADEIPSKTSFHFFTDKLHPDDYEKTMDAMRAHLSGRADVYEVEYRIQTKAGSYKWYYDRGRITQYDKNGKPLLLAGIVFDITEKKETQLNLENKNKDLEELTTIDELTNIKNYRALIEHAKAEIMSAGPNSRPVSMAIFDIDYFKKVNDTKGHPFGNIILKELVSIMKNCIRERDFLGRYGGEEFMIVFSDTDLKGALAISERIRKAVEEYGFPEDTRITISAGVKEYHGEELAEFIRSADANLYEAKKRGRNMVV